jgi:hypothetical protein
MFTNGVATMFIVVLSVAAQIPGTVYKIVFGPLAAEDGVKSPVTVFTPTPDQEPPGRDALNVTGDEFAQSAAGKSVIVTTGASITVIGTVEAEEQTSFKVYVIVYGPPTPATPGLKFPEGETPGPDQLPPTKSAVSISGLDETQT